MGTVSIIVPCFNAEKTIERCVKSLLSQSYESIEVVCVDDASNDRTVQILKKIKDKRLKIIINTQNSKPLECRRIGLENSSGEYIMFVDSDDYLESNACRVALTAIKKANADIVEFKTNVIDSGKNIEMDYCNVYDGSLYGKEVFEALVGNKIGQMVWNKVYTRKIVSSAYEKIPHSHIYYKDDVYFCGICYAMCTHYHGITNRLYNYELYSGGSRVAVNTIRLFEDRCTAGFIWNQLLSTLHSCVDPDRLNVYLTSKMNRWFSANVSDLFRLEGEKVDDCLEILVRNWEPSYESDLECVNQLKSKIKRTREIVSLLQYVEYQAANKDELINYIMSGAHAVPFYDVYNKDASFEEKVAFLMKIIDLESLWQLKELLTIAWDNRKSNQDVYFNVSRKAAYGGSALGMGMLGRAYRDAIGIERNDNLAIKWLRMASDYSMNWAKWEYFDLLWKIGTDESLKEMIRFATAESDAGNMELRARLARAYRDGKGVDVDLEKVDKLIQSCSVGNVMNGFY